MFTSRNIFVKNYGSGLDCPYVIQCWKLRGTESPNKPKEHVTLSNTQYHPVAGRLESRRSGGVGATALVQTLSIEHQEPKRSFTLHAASTASQTCGTSAATLLMFDVSNCPFLIFCTNSIPLKVTAALLKLLNPSIG